MLYMTMDCQGSLGLVTRTDKELMMKPNKSLYLYTSIRKSTHGFRTHFWNYNSYLERENAILWTEYLDVSLKFRHSNRKGQGKGKKMTHTAHKICLVNGIDQLRDM